MSDTIPQDSPQFKLCNRCKRSLPVSCFTRDKGKKDGLRTICRECTKIKPLPIPPVPDGLKRCAKCKQIFPATLKFFQVRTDRPSGMRSECVECSRLRSRNDAAKHREQRKEYSRRYRQANPEKVRESWKIYRRTHYQQRMEYKRRYRETHHVEILAYANQYGSSHAEQRRAWRQSNKLLLRIYSQRYRAKKREIKGTHTPEQIQEQLKRQKCRCYYAACGHAKFEKRNGKYIFHIEHTFPVSRAAGTDIPANDMSLIVLACPSCNHKKGNKLPHEWPEGGRLL